MKTIILSCGAITLVADEDFEEVSKFKWFLHVLGYVYRPKRKNNISVGGIYLHRVIMQEPRGIVDHINRDKLDNRRENLRIASRSQNALNAGLPLNNTSGFRGVDFDRARAKWSARIKVSKRQHCLGRFSDKRDAIRARALAELWFRKAIYVT